MTRDEHLVVFTPGGKRGRVSAGTTVLDAARRLGVDLDSVCGGRGLCGRCQVRVASGEMPKHGFTSRAEALSPGSATEERFDTRRGLAEGCRLGCQARIVADVAIDVPAFSQVHQPLVRKDLEARVVDVDPVVRLHYVELPEPATADEADADRTVLEALECDWALTGLAWEPTVEAAVADTIARGGGALTVAVRGGERIVGAWPGFVDRLFGLAVDIGSTTLAAYLCDLATGEVVASAGAMNPQIRFGEDVMSRVSYAALNPGGAEQLTAAVREALAALVAPLVRDAGVARDRVLETVLVGNPIMHHIVLGLDPVPLGTAPFTLATKKAVRVPASHLSLGLADGAEVYVPPCIAGHVGADTAAVLLAEAPWERDEVTLIVDVGTNAEMVLGNRERLLAASSPTGPAFEGAQVSCGQRATPGAIERVRIDRASLEPRFKIIGSDLWSDDAGFGAATEGIGVTGICGSGIIEALAEMFLSGVLSADGVIDGSVAERTERVVRQGRTFAYVLHGGEPPIRIEQNDVRAIQLAKGALYAGARLLMERLGVDRVDRIRLAGAFGSHVDARYAMVLGMIPDCAPERATAAGNAAGSGARMALLSGALRGEIEARVDAVEKIETATEPRFQHHFVQAMAIPHAADPFPELARIFDLPAARRSGRVRPRRGRRR